jgi:hypothetical protein
LLDTIKVKIAQDEKYYFVNCYEFMPNNGLIVSTYLNPFMVIGIDNGYNFLSSSPACFDNIIINSDGNLYGIAEENLFVKSNNYYLTWDTVPNISYPYTLIFNQNNRLGFLNTDLYHNGYQYLTTDNGLSWQLIADRHYPIVFGWDSKNNMYAFDDNENYGYILISTDTGRTFRAIDSTLKNDSPSNFYISPDDELYVTTYSNGYYKSRKPISSVYGALKQNTDNVLIFPNPAENKLNLRIISEEILLGIDIYDYMGINISGHTENICTNNNTYSIDISSLQNGAYFCIVKYKNKSIIKPFIKRS